MTALINSTNVIGIVFVSSPVLVAELSGKELSGTELSGTELSGKELSGTEFSEKKKLRQTGD